MKYCNTYYSWNREDNCNRDIGPGLAQNNPYSQGYMENTKDSFGPSSKIHLNNLCIRLNCCKWDSPQGNRYIYYFQALGLKMMIR